MDFDSIPSIAYDENTRSVLHGWDLQYYATFSIVYPSYAGNHFLITTGKRSPNCQYRQCKVARVFSVLENMIVMLMLRFICSQHFGILTIWGYQAGFSCVRVGVITVGELII